MKGKRYHNDKICVVRERMHYLQAEFPHGPVFMKHLDGLHS